MLSKLAEYERQLSEMDKKLSDGEFMKDMKAYTALTMERSHLAPIIDTMHRMQKIDQEIKDARELLKGETDADLIEMAKEELSELEKEREEAEKQCKMLLIPPDPLDGKNIIMEIRAGTGGDEAALFAADLFRMYTHYAETKRWKLYVMSSN